MYRHKIQKSSSSTHTTGKKSSPLTQIRPWTNPYLQRNTQAEQQPANTVKPPTTEEWLKDNIMLRAIETRKAELQQQAIQAKLTVGEPGDKYEQEADAMASQVMSMSEPAVQKESEQKLQTKPLAQGVTPVIRLTAARNGSIQAQSNLENRLNNSKGGGSPLSNQVRGFMQPRFGADFSQVRVHTDSTAVQMSRDLGAQAFTHGSDIYYGEGKAPGNNELTAHELTHVVQQTGAHNIQRQEQSTPQQEDESNHEAMLDEAISIIQNALNILGNQTQGEGNTSANPIPDAEKKKQDLQRGLTELQALKGSGKKEEIISATQPIIAAAKGDMTQATTGEQPSQEESRSDSVPAIQRRVTVPIRPPQPGPRIPRPAPQPGPRIPPQPGTRIPRPAPQPGPRIPLPAPQPGPRISPRAPGVIGIVIVLGFIVYEIYEYFNSPKNTDPNTQTDQTEDETKRREPVPIEWPEQLTLPEEQPLVRTTVQNEEAEEVTRLTLRNRAVIRNFLKREREAGKDTTGKHVHHKRPLFLGGSEQETNLELVEATPHLQGHSKLRNQGKMKAMYPREYDGLEGNLYHPSHTPGTTYRIIGRK